MFLICSSYSRSRLLERQAHPEMRSTAALEHLDAAAMGEYVLLHHGEPDTRPAHRSGPGVRALVERVEDARALRRRYALPLVDDVELERIAVQARHDANALALGRELHGVGHEVVQHHAQLLGISGQHDVL